MNNLSSEAVLYGASVSKNGDPGVGLAVVMGVFVVIYFVVLIVFYLYTAFCLVKIAQKTNTPDAWWGWIPILRSILLIKIAQKPIWWFVLTFIPFVNIVVMVLIFMEVAKRLGKPDWWGILMIVPLANLVVLGLMAFSKNEVVVNNFTSPINDQGMGNSNFQQSNQQRIDPNNQNNFNESNPINNQNDRNIMQ